MSTKVNFWKLSLLTIAVLLNIILALRLVWGSHSFSAYRALTTRCQDIMEEIKKSDIIIAELSHEIQLLHTDPVYIEKMIRQRLNFLKDNEVLYLFTSKDN